MLPPHHRQVTAIGTQYSPEKRSSRDAPDRPDYNRSVDGLPALSCSSRSAKTPLRRIGAHRRSRPGANPGRTPGRPPPGDDYSNVAMITRAAATASSRARWWPGRAMTCHRPSSLRQVCKLKRSEVRTTSTQYIPSLEWMLSITFCEGSVTTSQPSSAASIIPDYPDHNRVGSVSMLSRMGVVRPPRLAWETR